MICWNRFARALMKQIIGEKIEASYEEIKFKVSFDFTIETTKTKYKTNIELNLPTSEFGEDKNCYLEINDTSNIIFKRVK